MDEADLLHCVPDSDAGELEIRAVVPVEETFGTLRDEGLGVAMAAPAPLRP